MSVTIPGDLAEAVDVLRRRPATLVLAGGTDLMVAFNEGTARPEAVLAVSRLPELRRWSVEGDEISLGAGLTYTQLLEPTLAALVPGLAQAARTVGSPQIRNAGTLGGNIATASPAGDTLPVLVALRAVAELVGPDGPRRLPVGDLLVGPKQNGLRSGELVRSVRVPLGGAQEYLKVGGRTAMVIAVASVALVVDAARRRVGVGLGSVAPTATHAPLAEACIADHIDWGRLRWRSGGDEGTRRAALLECLERDAAPIDDHRGTARYRSRAAGVLVSRAAERVLGGAAWQ